MKKFFSLLFLVNLCFASSDDMPPKEILAILNDHTPLQPTKVFDNVYCIGTKSVVAWVIKTSDGIILIDSMWGDRDAKLIEDGLKEFNLDPKDVKYIIVTHGHGDHYGGASYFQKKYGSKVLMSKIDEEVIKSLNTGPNTPDHPKPKVDEYVKTGDIVKLGDEDILVVQTPGHTAGTLSLIFPIKFEGKTYEAMIWGGTGVPSDKNLQLAYKNSINEFRKYVDEKNIQARINAHLFEGSGYSDLQAVHDKNFTKNPFIYGKDGINKYLDERLKAVDDKMKQK